MRGSWAGRCCCCRCRSWWAASAGRVRAAGDSEAARPAGAVGLFDDCVRHDGADERLAADARHNMELAKMLWVQAKARPAQHKDKTPPEEENPKSQPPKPEPVKQP